MADFLALGGYGFYVWGAYVVAAIALIAEVLSLRSKRRATLAEARLVAPTEIGE